MTEVQVDFVRDLGYGGDPEPLCTVWMCALPRRDDVVLLPDQGLQRWRVVMVVLDLRSGTLPERTGVAAWVRPF